MNISTLPTGCVGFISNTAFVSLIIAAEGESACVPIATLESKQGKLHLVRFSESGKARFYALHSMQGEDRFLLDFGTDFRSAIAYFDTLYEGFIANERRVLEIVLNDEIDREKRTSAR